MKIKKRLIILPLLLLLFAVLFFSVYREVKERTVADFKYRHLLLARQTASSIEALFKRYYNDLKYLSGIPAVIRLNSQGIQLLSSYLHNNPELKAVTRVDEKGRIIFTIPEVPGAIGADISGQEHMKEILERHQPVISDVFWAVQNYWTVAYHVPVWENDKFSGTLAILIPFNKIVNEFLAKFKTDPRLQVFVVSKKGNLLFTNTIGKIGAPWLEQGEEWQEKAVILKEMMRGIEGSGKFFNRILPDKAGQEMLAVYHPIILANTYWSICIAAPESEVLQALLGFRNKLIFIFMGLFVLGIVYARYFLKAEWVLREEAQRREQEKMLREREARFREMADLLPVAVYEADLSGRLTFANRMAYSLFNYSQNDLENGLYIQEMVVKEELPKAKREIQRIIEEDAISSNEYTAINKFGDKFPVLIRSSRILKDGVPVGLRGAIADLSEQKSLEEQFQQAQKMEAIGKLAGGIAHDFNNLLTVILGYAELLLNKKLPTELREPVRQISLAGERAKNLTSQLLAFSRKQLIQPKTLDLNRLIEKTKLMLERLLGENIRLETDLAPNLPKIKADPHQIDQILMNLCVNARDSIRNRGNITILTRTVENNRPLNLPTDKKFICLSVADSGEGIPPEILPRIFEPFFTTKEVGQGSGLGLSTVYGIVKQNGGEIRVQSRLGQGTRFDIYLPALSEDEMVVSPVLEGHSKKQNRLHVWLVEDEDGVRQFITDVLRINGIEVTSFSSGKDVLNKRSNMSSLPPDLLITDLNMPELSGERLAEKLRETFPNLKVIFISGFNDSVSEKKESFPPDVLFLPKPLSAKRLIESIFNFVSE
ncbi:MAG: hypothetical protein Kow0037_31630 [Calditrichia bacterium]